MNFNDLTPLQLYPYGVNATEDTHFNNEIKVWVDDDGTLSLNEYMTNMYDFYDTELELIEDFAAQNRLIESESELSNRFDGMIRETMDLASWFKWRNDSPAQSEMFNGFTDNLVSDGNLHQLQCDEYVYVNCYEDIKS